VVGYLWPSLNAARSSGESLIGPLICGSFSPAGPLGETSFTLC
jgi:hypothetical protein